MKRRSFVSNLIIGIGGVTVFPSLIGCKSSSFSSSDKVKFGVVTDVHKDFFPEANQRLRKFIQASKAANVDFIIQLGDFSYPKSENSDFVEIWDSFSGDKFHVLGNHDMDENTKDAFLEFFNQEDKGNYFSYDRNGFHFVVLDNNFIKKDSDYIPYEFGNYYEYSGSEINQIPPEQIQWLKKDIEETDLPVILFSHVPIVTHISNKEEVLEVLHQANLKEPKVIGAFSGHLHKNWHLEKDGVNHFQINSASYKWVGNGYPAVEGRYSPEIEEEYPLLPRMAPYDDSLFAIVEIDKNTGEISIEGREADWIPPSPVDLGYYEIEDQMSPSTKVDSRLVNF